jgi:Zyg-11 family protein
MVYYLICISLSVTKISTSEKSVLGSQPQYMRKLLSIVKSKVQTSCVDVTTEYTLGALMNLTGEFLHS